MRQVSSTHCGSVVRRAELEGLGDVRGLEVVLLEAGTTDVALGNGGGKRALDKAV